MRRAAFTGILLSVFWFSGLMAPSGLMAQSYLQTGRLTWTVDGGVISASSFLVTGGLSTSVPLTLVPNQNVNFFQANCSGTGVSSYTGSATISGQSTFLIPFNPTSVLVANPKQVCTVNFGTLPNTDYATSTYTFLGSTVGFPAASTLSIFLNDPIATSSGELTMPPTTDLDLGGPLPVTFSRTYSAFLNNTGITTRIGNNWMHNFEWLLTLSGNTAQVTFYGGQVVQFNLSGSNWLLASPERYGYQFATLGNNTYQFLDPQTNLIYTFSGTGTTLGNTKIQDRNGNTLTINLPSNGLSSVTDGLGRVLTLSYDLNGKLMNVADQVGRSVSFGYTGNDLTQFTDANGKITKYSVTSAGGLNGLITGTLLPLGNKPFSQTFDTIGRVVSQSDGRGNTTSIIYDHPVGSASAKDPLGATVIDTARSYADLLTHTDPDNQTISVGYDANDHRNLVTDRLGNKIATTFHSPSGYVASITDIAGNTTTNTWTAQVGGTFTFYILTRTDFADGTSMSYTYDQAGNRLSATDRAGKIWRWSYNTRGQVLARTDPNSRSVYFSYNTDGTVASTQDTAGNITTYSYDPFKRVDEIKFADGTLRSLAYDGLNNVVKAVDERNRTTAFAYNDNNHVQSITDPLGRTTTIGYDSDDHINKITDRTGQSSSFVYNELGLAKSATTPAGETFTFNYDSHHRMSAAFDPSGRGFNFAYDKEDGLASIIDPLSRKTTLTRDPFGVLTKTTTPSGAAQSVNLDKFELSHGGSDPAGVLTTIGFDARGISNFLAIGSGDPSAGVSIFRDDSGLLTKLLDPNGNNWLLGRDIGGRLNSRTDPLNRATTYTFDKRNRVAGATLPGALGSATFTYDAVGNLLRRQYSDGTDLGYTFDDNRRITSATGLTLAYDFEDRILNSNGLIIVRDFKGRISSITYGVGKIVKYSYDANGLLASVSDWLSGATTFTYDAAHQLISLNRGNGRTTQFTYDVDSRLASISEDSGTSIVLKRDSAGKVTSETRAQPVTVPAAPALAPGVMPLAYDAGDQVGQFSYDGLGRVLTDRIHKFVWDLGSRLVSYTGPDGIATASYDGLGLRTALSSASSGRYFIWNYATTLPSLAIVQDPSANDVRYYIYTPDGALLYAVEAATGARHFYHFDENGSTTLLTNDAGAVTDSFAITPYGETVTQSGPTDNPFTWMGQFGVMQEGSTGLYYMRARYYDSTSARFLSPDPVTSAHPLKINPYQYAMTNPLAFADPRGLDGAATPNPFVAFKVNQSWGRFDETLSQLKTTPGGTVMFPQFAAPGFIDPTLATNPLGVDFGPTSLLFPITTEAPGFDTGLAIANTSSDPFGTNQSGCCALNFYCGGSAAAAPPSSPVGGSYANDAAIIAAAFQGAIQGSGQFQNIRVFPIFSALSNLGASFPTAIVPIGRPKPASIETYGFAVYGGMRIGLPWLDTSGR